MKSILCFLIFIVAFNIYFDTAVALSCYSCVAPSGQNDNCELNVSNDTVAIETCDTGYTTCVTVEIDNTVARACAVDDVCQMYTNITEAKSCSTCSFDLCNHWQPPATSIGGVVN